jgi:hypothetical protein
VNLVKVPFSVWLGLIRTDTLTLNLMLVPAVYYGHRDRALADAPRSAAPVRVPACWPFAFVAALRLVGLW